jgi:serine carboxypeptidase-like clade 2
MDDVCPITATRYSVKDLNLTVTKPWRPWYTPANEVMHELRRICDRIIYMC